MKLSVIAKAVVAVAVITSLSGCISAAQEQKNNEARAYIASNTPVVGNSKEECDQMWSKTQYYITKNSGMKLQTVSDFAIQTFNATQPGRYTGTATKINQSGDKCAIDMSLSFVSGGTYLELTANMIRFVKGA